MLLGGGGNLKQKNNSRFYHHFFGRRVNDAYGKTGFGPSFSKHHDAYKKWVYKNKIKIPPNTTSRGVVKKGGGGINFFALFIGGLFILHKINQKLI